jgi:hypothetical protein
MSTRTELRTLIRLAPEATTDTISTANLDTLLDRATIDLASRARLLPRNEKVNTVASQREYVISGSSPVLTSADFLELDLDNGGVLWFDGTDWRGIDQMQPKTRLWLDEHDLGWRTRTASDDTPLYWYLDTAEDNANSKVIGFSHAPASSNTDYLWFHWIGRGTLMTDDTHYPWTGTTTELVHLAQYDTLLVYYCLEWINRLITKNSNDANEYLQLYLAGAQGAKIQQPLRDHLSQEGFVPPGQIRSHHGHHTGFGRHH